MNQKQPNTFVSKQDKVSFRAPSLACQGERGFLPPSMSQRQHHLLRAEHPNYVMMTDTLPGHMQPESRQQAAWEQSKRSVAACESIPCWLLLSALGSKRSLPASQLHLDSLLDLRRLLCPKLS